MYKMSEEDGMFFEHCGSKVEIILHVPKWGRDKRPRYLACIDGRRYVRSILGGKPYGSASRWLRPETAAAKAKEFIDGQY